MNRSEFLKRSAMATIAGVTMPLDIIAENTLTADRYRELSAHKISDIKFFDAVIRWPRFVGKNARRDDHGTGNSAGACLLRTDKGAEGWGLMEGRKDNYTKLTEQITGKKVSDLFTPGSGMLIPELKIFEIAFFDLSGIILDKPVYKLLGARKPLPNKYYSGMIYLNDLHTKEKPAGIDTLLKDCEYDYSVGYRQFKIKIGRGNMWMDRQSGDRRDADVTLAIAKAFPDCEILVDANDGYTPEGFINFLRMIGDTKLFWVEEPFAESLDSCRLLSDWMKKSPFSRTLYAEGEYGPDFNLMKQLTDNKLIDVLLYDIISYGWSKWRSLLPSLKGTGITASPHAWGSGIKSNYIIHLCSTFGNTATIEGVTSFSDDVDLTAYKIRNGMVTPPDLPGFGMKLIKRL